MAKSDDEDVVPHFVPSLASNLAMAETNKGAPLTEEEVLATVDKSPCIMVQGEDAKRLSREFIDVDPEDAWADWHRVRAQMVGGIVPSFVLTVTCGKLAAKQIMELLKQPQYKDYEVEKEDSDSEYIDRLQSKASRYKPVLTEKDFQTIAAHDNIIRVSGPGFIPSGAIIEAGKVLSLVSAMIEIGALSVCCESSYLVHSNEVWKKFAADFGDDRDKNMAVLCQSFVQAPIEDEDDFFTCGLHLLGLPDLVVSRELMIELFETIEKATGEAGDLFFNLAVYLLTECKERRFRSGHTFSLKADAPVFRVVWEQDCGFPETSVHYNPAGRRRLTSIVN